MLLSRELYYEMREIIRMITSTLEANHINNVLTTETVEGLRNERDILRALLRETNIKKD